MVIFRLRQSAPIAQGHKRFVFQHPADPNLLIKVWQPGVVEGRWGGDRPWYRRSRYGQYVSLQREFSEHLALAARFPDGVPVLQHHYGAVPTDYGLGVVVEKLVGRDGGLAPTLAELARSEGATVRLVKKLEQFRDEMLRYGIVVGKLHERNLVLACRDGEERFIMIDGYGEKTALPIHIWSSRLNAAHTRRKVDSLITNLKMHFSSRVPAQEIR